MKNGAHLIGPGWDPWRGVWEGSRCLIKRSGGWVLEEGEREIDRWPDLRGALLEIWPKRRIQSSAPWAVGWIGYEELAGLAGDLPARMELDFALQGFLILEPEFSGSAALVEDVASEEGLSARWSLDAASFREGVSTVRERIAAGDVYQVCLSRRLSVEGWAGSLWPLAASATEGGVPDYLARVRVGDCELVCASMEMFLRRRGVEFETRPIKGTRPRGESADDDRKWAAELEDDPKERAELAMIVDLERNDLGRISEAGSVRVVDPGSVRSYAAVHHRVARVVGRAREGVEWWDALAALAPGGSVTGCPKIAAMSVIRELEPIPRGVFCGALGIVAGDGDLELALPIRTAWKYGPLLEFAAGCGIVWESDAESEERESRLKLARWLEIIDRGGLGAVV